MDPLKESRMGVVKKVRQWAGATTDAILDPSMGHFRLNEAGGFIAYREESKQLIVFGDPTCDDSERAELTNAFHQFAQNLGKIVIYISASHDFAYWSIQNGCGTLIEFGNELFLNPEQDPSKVTGEYASLVRRKMRTALREKIEIHEYLTRDPVLEQSMDEVSKQWLNGRKGFQIHISDVYLFNDIEGKRWFYAKQGEKVIGVVCLNQIQKHQGWLLNHLMTLPDAPNGTSELLIIRALQSLGQEGCKFVTMGFVSPKKLGTMIGLSTFSQKIAEFMLQMARRFAGLDGLNMFWKKFNPGERPAYLIFSRKKVGIKELLGIKKALRVKNKQK